MTTRFKATLLILTFLFSLILPIKAATDASVTTETELTAAIADTTVTKINIEDDIDITAPQTIAREITIKSNPPEGSTVTKYTLDGKNTSSFFDVTAGGGTFDSLSLKNGKATVSGQNAEGGAMSIKITTAPATPASVSTVTISDMAFEGNNATISASGNVAAKGGALYLDSKQDITISDNTFTKNIASATSSDGGTEEAYGGAIYNKGTGALAVSGSTFEENEAGKGGAIYNEGSSLAISTGTFSKNKASVDGGAIYAADDLQITGSTFVENEATGNGGALVNDGATVSIKTSTFNRNKSGGDGGALVNTGTMSLSNTNMNGNEATGNGGGIYNSLFLSSSAALNILNSTAVSGGAIYNEGQITVVAANFTGNQATANGGALYTSNAGGYGDFIMIGGGSFTNNTAGGVGGAIFQDGSIVSLMSVAGLTFSGNTDINGANAIAMANGSILNLNAVDNTINFYDPITGDSTNTININGTNADDSNIPVEMMQATNAVNFYTDMPDFDGTINMYAGTLGVFADLNLNTTAFNAIGDVRFNMINNATNSFVINSDYTQSGTGKLSLDIDLFSGTADTIEATGTVTGAALQVDNVRLVQDSTGATTAPIFISNTFDISFDTSALYYGPIFEYTLSQPDTHNVVATKTNNFTPTVLASSISQRAEATNNAIVSSSLINRVGVMLSKDGRYYNAKNSYSLSKYDKFLNSEPAASFSDITQKNYYTTWFVPYSVSQDLDYKDNLEGVKNKVYGANAGIDLPVISMGDDFGFIPTFFVGYGGGSQKYHGLRSSKDSISGGVMGTVYAPYFYTTVEGHVTNGTESSTFNGRKDHFDVFTASGSAKAELSIPLFLGLNLQPNIAAYYNFVKTENYLTALGAPINNKPYNTVQVTPGVKLSADIKSWHPYGAWAYTHNAYTSAEVKIDNFTLPEFTAKDYSEYTIGVENTFLETYSGYLQYTGYNSGVSGYSLQMGLRGYIDF